MASARPRQSNRPIYEDFQPVSEVKEGEDAHVLTFQLPGFTRLQISITSVSYPRLLRLRGERALGNNKWSRFSQEIPVPPNVDMDKIQARFQNGILTITMQKNVPPKPTILEQVAKIPQEKTTPSTSKASADQPPKPTSTAEVEKQKVAKKGKEEETIEKANIEPKTQKVEDNISSKQEIPNISKALEKPQPQPQPQQVQENNALKKPTITGVAENQKDEKSTREQPKPKKVQEEAVKKTMTESEAKKADEEKLEEVKETEKVVDRTSLMEKAKKELEKGKESILADEKVVEKIKEAISKKIDGSIKEKTKEEYLTEKYMMGMKNIKEKAKGAVTNVLKMVNDEDMQMWVNVGATVLVIVAFGAYASYSYRSAGQSKK